MLTGASLSAPAAKTSKAGKKSRWDSTWFLILVGALLGLGLVGLVFAYKTLAA